MIKKGQSIWFLKTWIEACLRGSLSGGIGSGKGEKRGETNWYIKGEERGSCVLDAIVRVLCD